MGKFVIYYIVLILAALGVIALFIFNGVHFSDKYNQSIINEITVDSSMPCPGLEGYQSKYAVIPYETEIKEDQFKNDTYAAVLIDTDKRIPIVAHNALRRIYPASTTKVMTGVVVCDAISRGEIGLDDTVTLKHDIEFEEEDALASELKEGYKITVRNLLYGLLMRSYNDFAIILAEYVAGSEAKFVEMMNQKAYQIGATGCHFVNPHGLHDDDHYVTAYDMYLIMNESRKYDIINEIDSYTSFTYSYIDDEGYILDDDISPTNMFLAGDYKVPSNITIKEWKTGTTEAGGYILAMNVEIDKGNYFIYVADAVSPDDLYNKIGMLFNYTK
ncbi:MAG: D-alanyl-D-alanine carboxypeptidase [Eubacterium sp.]|nr:D-alanyl-D-alanine carboxypeptidase [Eubacterium sp.]